MSDLLIKGMEMPRSCVSCKLWTMQIIGGKGYDICRASDKVVNAPYGKPDWCPLIPVPEPHGRLIDADALDIYQRAEAAYAEYQEDEDNFYLEGMANGLCEAAKQLSVARTIIPASKGAE